MVSIRRAAEIIEANAELASFAGPVALEEMWVAEGRLGVRLPGSYREFLGRYGAGSFGGFEIYGLGVPDRGLPSVVWATEAMRAADDFFPGDLVVIQGSSTGRGGEGDILCLATGWMSEENECPVVQWIPEMSLQEQAFEKVNTTFAHFLLRVARLATRDA